MPGSKGAFEIDGGGLATPGRLDIGLRRRHR